MAAKVYDVETIKNKLANNDKWLIRGLLAIYAKQTADERAAETTSHRNGCGFNGTDANILSSFAKQVLAWQTQENPRYPTPLSPKQIGLLRRKLNKYAGQLVRIAEENNPVEERTPPVVDAVRQAFEAKKTQERDAAVIRAAHVQAREDREAAEEARAERAAIQAEEQDTALVETAMELGW